MSRHVCDAKQVDQQNRVRQIDMILEPFDTFDISQAFRFVGILGFLLYVGVFAALQLRWIDGNSIRYSCACVLAASLVLTSMATEFNLASALIQTAWILIGICGIALRLTKSPRPKQNTHPENAVASNRNTQSGVMSDARVPNCRRRLTPSNQNVLYGRSSRPSRHRRI